MTYTFRESFDFRDSPHHKLLAKIATSGIFKRHVARLWATARPLIFGSMRQPCELFSEVLHHSYPEQLARFYKGECDTMSSDCNLASDCL